MGGKRSGMRGGSVEWEGEEGMWSGRGRRGRRGVE